MKIYESETESLGRQDESFRGISLAVKRYRRVSSSSLMMLSTMYLSTIEMGDRLGASEEIRQSTRYHFLKFNATLNRIMTWDELLTWSESQAKMLPFITFRTRLAYYERVLGETMEEGSNLTVEQQQPAFNQTP